MNNVLQPSDSSENEQHLSHLDQGNEIDGELNFWLFYTLSPQMKNLFEKNPPYQFLLNNFRKVFNFYFLFKKLKG